jgi:hypothetical protein
MPYGRRSRTSPPARDRPYGPARHGDGPRPHALDGDGDEAVGRPARAPRGAVHICRYLMITRSRPTSSPPSIAVASPTALTAFACPRSFSVMSAPASNRCTST